MKGGEQNTLSIEKGRKRKKTLSIFPQGKKKRTIGISERLGLKKKKKRYQ